MQQLNFQTVMDFCRKHNQSVFQKIVEAQKNGTLSPFIGAGLSVPFGYKLWEKVLTELADYIPADEKKLLALDQIRQCKYEEAAGTILDAYPFMLDALPEIVSPDILKNCSDEKKRSSAAWVIPYLFRRELVMTTNFDRVLEECYKAYQNTVIPTVTPMNPDRLAQLQLNQELCLLKLHGDIGKEAVSIDDLVFTGEQYAAHYAEGSPLISVLSHRFSSRRMLFLGCSLSVDRTMKILEKVVANQKGIRHFAILGCKKSEIPARSKELERLGILPIFYDDGNHDAVRVILERLLEETNQQSYNQLRRACGNISKTLEEKRPLMFDSEYIPFSGREDSLECLKQFCKAEEQLLWWAVTGPGGIGKSRLVFEFCKSMSKEGWNIQRFEASPSRGSNVRSLEELSGWTPEATKTIIVLDDVQAYMAPVCDWLVQMGRIHRSEELRILLLERDGKNLADASWMGSNFRGKHLENWCYNEQFLHLKPLTDEQIMAVMSNYAKAAGKSLNAELLLKTLEKVDPVLKRPLYAVAIADARCQGKDPTNWDRGKILDTLLERELNFHLDRLQGISDRKVKISKTLQTQMEILLADACIRGFLLLDQVDWAPYNVLQKRMNEVEMDPEEFCQRLGILRTARLHEMRIDGHGNPVGGSDETREGKIIYLTCPDLLKEHLVLKLAFEKKKLELLPDGWQHDPNRMNFLRRLWIDYPEQLKDQPLFWDRFFCATPVSGLPARFYGDLLWGTTDVFPEFSTRAVDVLQRLYNENANDETIAICYANGLVNLLHDQPIEEKGITISQLASLHKNHPDWTKVADRYAAGLVNLSSAQQLEECSATIERLALLHQSYPNCTEVTTQYAGGLFNLSLLQSPEDLRSTVEQLKELYLSYPDLVQIGSTYANTLVNLAYIKTSEDCAVVVEQLEDMYNTHPDLVEIGSAYANALVNLAFGQTTEAEVRVTLAKAEELLQKYPDNDSIQLSTAKTRFNLTLVQGDEGIPSTVAHICDFLRSHSGVIPKFKEALEEYLSQHPDHTQRYRPLLEL